MTGPALRAKPKRDGAGQPMAGGFAVRTATLVGAVG